MLCWADDWTPWTQASDNNSDSTHSNVDTLKDSQTHSTHTRQSSCSNEEVNEDWMEIDADADGNFSLHSINCNEGPFVDNEEGGIEIDGCLDPPDLGNAAPLELVDDHPEISTSDPTDASDPSSHADPKVDSCLSSPKLPQDNYSFSEGPDIEELLDNVKLEDLQLQLQFIQEINNALLEDEGTQMDKDHLHQLWNPFDHKLAMDDASELCLSLKLFLANINSPMEVYNANHAAMVWCHPNNDIFTYDRAK